MTRIIAGLVLVLGCFSAQAAAPAEAWARWQAHDEASPVTIDHGAWSTFLAKHRVEGSDGIARLRYQEARRDGAALNGYLRKLQGVKVARLARAEQRAFWINFYNAATLSTVTDHYPVESIRKIGTSPGLFTRGPWGRKFLDVEGETLSLDDIEHRILRPIWKDPRTHYAVNCASIGCPNLAAEAWTRSNLETLLDAGARAYVNHPRGARVENGRLIVSSIYKWFQEDFGGSDAGVIDHLRQYARPALSQALQGVTKIADHDYDWALNDLPPPEPE